MISFPSDSVLFKKPRTDSVLLDLYAKKDYVLNDFYVNARRKDFDMSPGFFIAPRQENQIKDSNVVIDSSSTEFAFVEILHQVIDTNNFTFRCKHIKSSDIVWGIQSSQTAFCDKCATLIRFKEFIKKYVSESENKDTSYLLWPWYRNYFSRRESIKYRKYIDAKGLSDLFDINDVVDVDVDGENSEKKHVPNKGYQPIDTTDEKQNIADSPNKKGIKQLREVRKSAAQVLLNHFDIERNLNIIRMQIAWIVKQNDSIDAQKQNVNDWNDWKEYISKCNKYISKDPDSGLIYPKDHEMEHYISILKPMFTSISKSKRCNIYNTTCYTIDGKYSEETPPYYIAFLKIWKDVPVWWNDMVKKENDQSDYYFNYDELLLELALEYGLDINQYGQLLEQQQNDRVGFNEFLIWVADWRNVQHRLRYLTFVICKYLKQCTPNIEDLKIIENNSQVSQYVCNSIIFLNGYMCHTHERNCNIKEFKSETDLENIQIDPFIKRDLDFELEQVLRSLDVCEFGQFFAESILKMCKEYGALSLWKAFEILAGVLPVETIKHILVENRQQLSNGPAQVVQNIGKSMLYSSHSKNKIYICLFLANYMQENARRDKSRLDQWMEFADEYQKRAIATAVNIESDLLLLMYLIIPLFDKRESLLAVAIRQRSDKFLSNPRIVTVLNHLWESASALNPYETILLQPMTAWQTFKLIATQPFHFYLTPKGYDAASKISFILYVICVYIFMAQRTYLSDVMNPLEWVVWILNFGYCGGVVTPIYQIRHSANFKFAALSRMWSIIIAMIWVILFFVLKGLYVLMETYESDIYMRNGCDSNVLSHVLCEIYVWLWSIQAVMLAVRSLLLFQDGSYVGTLLKIIVKLSTDVFRLLFVLSLLMFGYAFGLYYLSGFYLEEPYMSMSDWSLQLIYLFEVTLTMRGISDFEGTFGSILFVISYVLLATVFLMSLLIALITGSFIEAHEDASKESALAKAYATYTLTQRSRTTSRRRPFYVFILSVGVVIHLINCFLSLIFPGGVYRCINQSRYKAFYFWKCYCCCCPKTCSGNVIVNHETRQSDTYNLFTRKNTMKYHLSTFWGSNLQIESFYQYHNRCYVQLLTLEGTKQEPLDRDANSFHGIDMTGYLKLYKKRLDPNDIKLLKEATTDVLFCKVCYKAFDPKQSTYRYTLSTPFRALLELISIYSQVIIFYIPLLVIYFLIACYELLLYG